MASLLCVRQPGGTLKIHDEYRVEKLGADVENEHAKLLRKQDFVRRQQSRESRPYTGPAAVKSSRSGVDPEALIGHTMKLQEWLSDKQVKSVQEKTDNEAKSTKQIYDPVLETEDTFVKDISDFLDYNKMLAYRKKEFLQKQWDKNVFQPIRKEINKEVNGQNYEDLSIRKRRLHKEYLEHTNKKGHVFLDTFAADEYYPMSLHPVRPSLLVAATNKLQDPLLTQERARTAEDRVILQCSTGRVFTDRDIGTIRLPPLPMVPLGRHGTGCNTWLEMPMGDIESPVRLASRQRMSGNYNHSKFNFSDWSTRFDNSIVDQEMALQKRKKFPMEHMMSQIPQMYSKNDTKDASTQVEQSTVTVAEGE